jgi:hypothetical protein
MTFSPRQPARRLRLEASRLSALILLQVGRFGGLSSPGISSVAFKGSEPPIR